MARNNNKLTKCMRDLSVSGFTASGLTRLGYLDIAQQLSRTNRKLFSQGYCYGVADANFLFTPSAAYDLVQVELSTVGDTWSVHNAWTKGRALWDQMNELVLEDNPSIDGKWADYKVFFDTAHKLQVSAGNNLDAQDSEGVDTIAGAWLYSQYVLPQHEVDAATGLPLPADQTFAHLLGPDQLAGGGFSSVGLVNAYAESRATVFDNNPNVPAGFDSSFFNQLTDSGSQEPELAIVIAGANDDPPYDLLEYPGGATNSVNGWISSIGATTSTVPVGHLPGFIAQCGLVKVVVRAYLDGELVPAPDITINFDIAPGMYKGVAAIPMGQ
ncbi:MAG: hypothetical protein [Circoviridae sp.]|nr:MAG: hypothetical protein [Circoviridae sp.]